MSQRININGEPREFDPKRYAALIVALAKHLVSQAEKSSSRTPTPPASSMEVDDER